MFTVNFPLCLLWKLQNEPKNLLFKISLDHSFIKLIFYRVNYLNVTPFPQYTSLWPSLFPSLHLLALSIFVFQFSSCFYFLHLLQLLCLSLLLSLSLRITHNLAAFITLYLFLNLSLSPEFFTSSVFSISLSHRYLPFLCLISLFSFVLAFLFYMYFQCFFLSSLYLLSAHKDVSVFLLWITAYVCGDLSEYLPLPLPASFCKCRWQMN